MVGQLDGKTGQSVDGLLVGAEASKIMEWFELGLGWCFLTLGKFMAEVGVKHLGLAAFIKMNNAVLVRVEEKIFFFESDRSVREWRIAYNNSCCMRHDALVCELRHHLKSLPT